MKFSKLFIFSCIVLSISLTFSQSVSFITFGDWGRNGQDGQQQDANAMAKYTSENKNDFILVLGDNFYPTGVKSTDDMQWETSFENIYTAPSLQSRWYVTLGNHDYGGNVQAQIDYTKLSQRWYLPSRYYSFEQEIDKDNKVLFVIIDSNPFVTSYHIKNKEDDELNDSSVADINRQDTKLQLQWLENELSKSSAKWKIVCGHHPVYSGGMHGNTPELVEQVRPLLEKYNVTLYLCGHDHDMQHLKNPNGIVNYFVAGSGSKLRNAGTMEYTLYTNSVSGFLAVNITSKDVTASFIDTNGNILYSTIIK